MSHYTRVKTQLKSTLALMQALADLGFGPEKIKHDTTGKQHLEGYEGKMREQTAEIIIPRKHVGGASNDIGFQLQEDGTYEAIISEYDKRRYDKKWVGKLTQRYAYNNLKNELSDGGFFIESEKEEKGEIFLQVGTSFGS
jgi:hypothetical protein